MSRLLTDSFYSPMRVRVCVNRGKKTSAGFENAYRAAAGDLLCEYWMGWGQYLFSRQLPRVSL